MKVRVNSLYFYNPVLLDRLDSRIPLVKGERVRVVNIHGCPKANTMGHCYAIPADAVKDSRGHWTKDFAMVSCNSLQKEPVE